jgi:thiol-disulfide isomerase/thioredoxin
LRGKVVLLNFWATWCGPCLAEIPQFARWQRDDAGRGLQVIGVSMDDDAAPVRVAYQKYHLNYPVVMGDEQLGELFGGVYGLPLTLLIGRDGRIRARLQGAADLNEVARTLEQLLKQK